MDAASWSNDHTSQASAITLSNSGIRQSSVQSAEKFSEQKLEAGNGGADELLVARVAAHFAVTAALGEAVDFDELLLWKDDPVFADAGLGIQLGHGAIGVRAGDRDFDGERGGARMGAQIVAPLAGDDGQVRLRFGIAQGQRFFAANEPARRELRGEQ